MATGVEADGSGKLASFKQHLDSVKGTPWIWVVDCREMPNSSISFVIGLFKILKRDHAHTLKEIWVLFPTTWTNMIVQLFKKLNSAAGIFHKVTVFDGHNLEIYHGLEKRGLSGEPFLWLTKTFIA